MIVKDEWTFLNINDRMCSYVLITTDSLNINKELVVNKFKDRTGIAFFNWKEVKIPNNSIVLYPP